jgi:signal transduction histidine kinase
MLKRSSIAWPIVLAAVLLTLIVGLLVIWIIGQATVQQWGLLAVGTVILLLIIGGVVAYMVITIKEIALNQRQANFIDAVTHELKSPIASIKLYLQTLEMRDVSPEQQREFHRFMLDDVQRLDGLIDHLLAVARVGSTKPEDPEEDIPLVPLLTRCSEDVCRRHELPLERVTLDVQPCVVRGRVRDLEMVFTNLLDNAVKYGGREPEVVVQSVVAPNRKVTVRVSDNGRGVRFEMRGKIFRRFFRGGSELERTTKGTGLGLYIVNLLVRRMRGMVQVHGRGPLRGATFEVTLPGVVDSGTPATT